MVEMLVGCSGINFTEARIKIVGIMSLEILSLARHVEEEKLKIFLRLCRDLLRIDEF